MIETLELSQIGETRSQRSKHFTSIGDHNTLYLLYNSYFTTRYILYDLYNNRVQIILGKTLFVSRNYLILPL